jgi:hypothetical protein
MQVNSGRNDQEYIEPRTAREGWAAQSSAFGLNLGSLTLRCGGALGLCCFSRGFTSSSYPRPVTSRANRAEAMGGLRRASYNLETWINFSSSWRPSA